MSKTRRKSAPPSKERPQKAVVPASKVDYCSCGCGRVLGSHKVVRVVEL